MKNKITKAAAIFLTTALVLVGCAEKTPLNSNNPTVITVWNYYTSSTKVAFDTLVDNFNSTLGQEKGVIVESSSFGNLNMLSEAVKSSANKEIGAEEMPNIFSTYVDGAYEIESITPLADLSKYLTEDEVNSFVPSFIEEGKNEKGEIKIFPVAKAFEVLALNKTDWEPFAKECNISEDDLSTFEGIAQAAEKYYEYSGGKAFFGRDAYANYMNIGSKQLGYEIVLPDGTVNLDKPTFKKLWDNFYVPYVKGYFSATGKFRSDDIKSGEILAMVCSTTGTVYFPGEVNINDISSYEIKPLILPPPRFENGGKFAIQQGAGMAVSQQTEAENYASVLFLKWLTAPQRNLEFTLPTGYFPVLNDAYDEEKILAAVESLELSDALSQAANVGHSIFNNGELYYTPVIKNGNQVRALLEKLMVTSAQTAVEQIDQRVANGERRDEAAAEYITEEEFENYFAQLKKEIEKLG